MSQPGLGKNMGFYERLCETQGYDDRLRACIEAVVAELEAAVDPGKGRHALGQDSIR